MAELEVIDYLAPDSDQRFVESLRAIGFAALKNHPLDMVLVNSIYDRWREFFQSERKFEYAVNRNTQDGYFSTQDAESAKGQEEQDFKEYYHFYTWGQCPEELRQELQTYYDAAHKFAATLLGWVETYAPNEVSKHFTEPLSNMIKDSQVTLLRILHYPPIQHQGEVTWAAAHEDINLLTILPASNEPGLQVQQKNGEWLDVNSDANQIVVNIGDMLQEASGGYFPSTTHRVVTPAELNASMPAGPGRMSLPLFLHPRPEVRLSNRYTAGSYLEERLKELGVV